MLVFSLSACSGRPANEAVAVAEKFLDLYFVEVDQERALPLTTGLAREVLEKELRDVAAVRAGGADPSQARGRAYYKRTYLKEDPASASARLVYDLTMEYGERADKTQRHVLLSLRREEGQWRVSSFTVREGHAIVPSG
jgi:hypothetical protein